MIAYGLWVGQRDKEAMKDFMAWGRMHRGMRSRAGRRRRARWTGLRRSTARRMAHRDSQDRTSSALR